jgi:hypothetical protein
MMVWEVVVFVSGHAWGRKGLESGGQSGVATSVVMPFLWYGPGKPEAALLVPPF